MHDGHSEQVDRSTGGGHEGCLRDIPLVAHRGYAARYPENTRESLTAAVSAGARWVEFDVQMSADGVPVLLHDSSLERTAGRAGRVFELSAADLTHMEVNENSRLGAAFSGVRIPLLQQVAGDLARWTGVTAFVEIKEESLDHFGTAFTVRKVLEALSGALKSCVLISFSAEAVREVRRECGCPVGWAVRSWSEQSRRLATRLAPEYLFCNYLKFPSPPESLWQGPWLWVAYEVAEPELAVTLTRRGVGMIETMAIAEMLGSRFETGRAESGNGGN